MILQILQTLLIVGSLAFITYRIYLFLLLGKKISNALNNSELPEEVANFPVYISTPEEFLSIRSGIEEFVEAAKKNQSFQLYLTADDINCLRTQSNISKNQSLRRPVYYRPEYYEIIENEIFEKKVVFPWPWNRYGYLNQIRSIKFSSQDNNITQISKIIYELNKRISQKQQRTLEVKIANSPLLIYIFRNNKTEQDQQNLIMILNKIQRIEVQNNHLILYV